MAEVRDLGVGTQNTKTNEQIALDYWAELDSRPLAPGREVEHQRNLTIQGNENCQRLNVRHLERPVVPAEPVQYDESGNIRQ